MKDSLGVSLSWRRSEKFESKDDLIKSAKERPPKIVRKSKKEANKKTLQICLAKAFEAFLFL